MNKKSTTLSNDTCVAVLLAAFNGEEWISEQIDSILNQKGVNITLYINIDLSSDQTKNICMDFSLRYSNIVILPYGKRYGSAAKNFFYMIKDINFNKYDYISLSDQDDIWLPEKIQRAVSVLSTKKIDAYSSDVIAFWSDGRRRLIKKSFPQKSLDYFFESSGPGCTFVLRRKTVELFKNFLISNWREINRIELHDWLLYAYVRHSGMEWFIDDNPLMLYRQHEKNVVGVNYGFAGFLKRLKMLKSYWYSSEVFKIHKLVAPSERFSLKTTFIIFNFFNMRRRPRDSIILLLFACLGMMRQLDKAESHHENTMFN